LKNFGGEKICCYNALKEVQIGESTLYEWRKGKSKTGEEFNKAYEEALEFKVHESRKNVQQQVNKYLKYLDEISEKSKNDNARVNAITKIICYAELDPQFKQELTIKANENSS